MTNFPFMKIALKEASFAKESGFIPVGCVLVYNNELVSSAYNDQENLDCFLPSPIAHAEVIAIIKACKKLQIKRLDDFDIYTTLEPCYMCAAAISFMHIKRVFFGAYDSQYGGVSQEIFKNFTHKPEIIGGVMESEASDLLLNFFKERR